jgi:AraC-like DNA-binding protein
MKGNEVLHIKNLHQYYAAAGLGKPHHPLMGIYEFRDIPELKAPEQVRFSLGFYVVTIKYNCTCKWLYGQTNFDYDEGIMGFFGPNQVMHTDPRMPAPADGWCLTFHRDFLLGYDLSKKIKDYYFFNYSINEALILSEDEERDMEELFQKIKKELGRPIDNFSQDVLVAQLDLLLTLSNRYYSRQFITRKLLNNRFLSRFKTLLDDYFQNEEGFDHLPTVSYFANELNLSSKYFSTMLKQFTGLTAQQYIHEKIIEIAKQQLSATNLTVAEIAYRLGFDYPQSFSKLFKAKTNLSPLDFRNSFN